MYFYDVAKSLSSAQFTAYEFNLIGMEALWEIVMQVRSEQVHEQAEALLARVYRRLDKETLENRLSQLKSHVLHCSMDMVKKGLADHQNLAQEERGANFQEQ
jgi:hypothetical protein